MQMWREVCRCICLLRPACSRAATFAWVMLAIVGMCARPDLAGVTSFVRAGWLKECCYLALLHMFHSSAVKLDRLTALWTTLVLALFTPLVVDGYRICVGDGIKIPKEGKKMPAVKCLHNESENNSKGEYIMGHSFQVVSLLVSGIRNTVFAVPLISRISEGVVFSNRDKRTLLDKFVTMFAFLWPYFNGPLLLVADAYYACGKVITPLLKAGHHLVTRVRSNAVGFYPAPKPKQCKRGRPKVYGKKVKLKSLFKAKDSFLSAPSPVYNERGVTLQYRCVDLLWRPVGTLVRFVLVNHPTRGRIILLCTNLSMDALTVIRLYGLRFKIEVSFKQAIHTLGTYAYHFWMMTMTPIKRWSGNQHLHRKREDYRNAVRRKLRAYHCYVQLGCIAQGLLQHLAINYPIQVWSCFRSWLRTMKTDCVPTEMVVAAALRHCLFDFLRSSPPDQILKKMILDNADPSRMPEINMAA